MADRNGYIGRAPSDSAVTVSRQSFSPTGVTTDFTFASGYTPGYFDLFINGVKMIEGSDYTSSDGSTFAVLNGGAQNGDVLEGVAYKAFNAASVSNANANFTVGGDLAVSGNLNVTGIATLGAGTSVSFATTAYALEGTPDLTIRNLTGVAATFTGVVTYEDVTNIDSVGIVTAQGGLDVTGGNVTIGTGSTVGFGSTAYFRDNAKAIFGDGEDLQIWHEGSYSIIQENGSGQMFFQSNGTGFEFRKTDGEDIAKLNVDGSVELYHDNALKLSTASIGATVTGSLLVGAGQSFGSVDGATAVYYGDGSNLTNLPAAGITTEAFTSSGIVTAVRLGTAQDHKITATGITTITSSGSGTEGESHTIRIVNSGIATVGFSTYFLFPSGAAPTLPTADGAISLISFTVHDSVGAGCTQLLAGASVNYS